MQKLLRETFPLAILAGICISIGCVVNLRVGGIAGAVLFAFGLTTVVYYGLKLYTGTAGFIRRQGDWTMLCVVLLGNIVGCLLSAWMIAYAQPDCIEPASKILAGRLAKGPWACFLLAIGCGFIMTTAVEFARKGKMLTLLLGVPVFILCPPVRRPHRLPQRGPRQLRRLQPLPLDTLLQARRSLTPHFSPQILASLRNIVYICSR